MVKFPNLSQKQKTSSEAQSTKNKELQKLTISDLEAISGGELGANHNEIVVSSKSK